MVLILICLSEKYVSLKDRRQTYINDCSWNLGCNPAMSGDLVMLTAEETWYPALETGLISPSCYVFDQGNVYFLRALWGRTRNGMGGVCNDEYLRIDWLEVDAVFNFPVEITRFQIAKSHGNQKSSVHKKHE